MLLTYHWSHRCFFSDRYNLMLACWSNTPWERPSFRRLEEQISQLRQKGEQLREEQQTSRGMVNYGFQDGEHESYIIELILIVNYQ